MVLRTGVAGCKDCEASTAGVCDRHGVEAYLRVSYTGEVEEAKARLAEVPHVCPVCRGRGFVSAGFYSSTSGISTTGTTACEPCRSCHGEGIVWRN